MIITSKLSFKHNKNNQVFNFPDLQLAPKEHLLILGKSGVGKTTFLHLLAGLLNPLDGTITIGDVNINKLSAAKRDQFRGKHIGLVFQKNHAIQSLTVTENLKARLFFSKKSVATNSIFDLLRQLDLLECKDKKAHQISVGQLQRLGIAMSVVHSPKIILADEPTSSLDDENCASVIELLKEQASKTGANLVIITHDQRVTSYFKNSISL